MRQGRKQFVCTQTSLIDRTTGMIVAVFIREMRAIRVVTARRYRAPMLQKIPIQVKAFLMIS